MTRSVNSLRYERANAHGEGILKTKSNKNVVPYRTLTTSDFGEGQHTFTGENNARAGQRNIQEG